MEFVSYFIFAFTSSLLKEVYCANTIKNYQFGPYRVICSTIIATVGTLAVKEIYNEELEHLWGVTATICTIFGLLGFEIFKHLTSIAGIKSLIKEIKEVEEEAKDMKTTEKKSHTNLRTRNDEDE